MPTLTEQMTALARATTAQIEDQVATGAACTTGDEDLWYPEGIDMIGRQDRSVPNGAARAMASRACDGCPVQAACLERALRLERALGTRGLYGIWGALPPVDRLPLHQHRREATTPDERAAAAPAVARELYRRGWTDPTPETGGGVDDEASRRPHGQHGPAARAALLADLHAEHYGTTSTGAPPTRDADERDAARELHARARRARHRHRHPTREEVTA